jgi:glycerol-3-phosphate dehydrogenase (NAD(P)+)
VNGHRAIGLLGAGSWGTALAVHLARNGHRVILWGRSPDHIAKLDRDRCNARYLPGVTFPDGLELEADIDAVLAQTSDLWFVVPSHALRETLELVAARACRPLRAVLACKGLEHGTSSLPHEVVAEVLGKDIPLAVASGPTFAGEVGRGLPTAMTVASADAAFADQIVSLLYSDCFRPYASADLVGVEVAGAVKNVIAIGAGVSDGLHFGANARVALITRGLAEIIRLGTALGAHSETFVGLAGVGDLVLTCTDDQSRNRRMGLSLAEGFSQSAARERIGQVVEGVQAAATVHQLAARAGVDMPITATVYRMLYEDLSPVDAVGVLMGRKPRREDA